MSAATSIVRVCGPRIARRLVAPTAIAVAVACALVAIVPRSADDPIDDAAGWLHLPILIVAASAIAALLDAWPGLGRDRPDRGLVVRLAPGPLGGAGPATLLALAISVPALALVGGAFELASPRPAERTFVAAYEPERTGGGVPRIDAETRSITFDMPASPVDTIELRPHMPLSLRGAFEETAFTVVDATGAPLGPQRTIERSGQLVRIDFPARTLPAIRIEHGGTGLPLLLPPGSVRALRDTGHGAVAAAVVTACSGIAAAALGAALVVLGRRRFSRGVALAAGCMTAVAATALGVAPTAAALRAFARDEWPIDARTSAAGMWSLSAFGAVMLLAFVAGRSRGAA